jgi:hypothetical protein
MFTIFSADQPLVLPLAYAVLREKARRRKESGEFWPWSSDPMLAGPRSFTNVRREDDPTTRWLADNLRGPMSAAGDTNWPAAAVLYRLLNRLEMGPVLFGRTGDNPSPFEAALAANSVAPLWTALAARPDLKVGGAYTIASLNRRVNSNDRKLDKREGVLANYATWFRNNGPIGWRNQFDYWTRPGVAPTLASAAEWFDRIDGVDLFVAAQFIADCKYVEPLARAPDWFTWAAPGPGSSMGLNIVCGRALEATWDKREFQHELRSLQDIVNPRLEAIGDAPLHAQDVQNVCCETSKAWRFMHDGKPAASSKGFRQKHGPASDRTPESESALRTRLEAIYADDHRALVKIGVNPRHIPKLADVETDMLAIWRVFRAGLNARIRPIAVKSRVKSHRAAQGRPLSPPSRGNGGPRASRGRANLNSPAERAGEDGSVRDGGAGPCRAAAFARGAVGPNLGRD